jgi:D-hydroxyproline dehydrogenase subunit alpha
MSSGSGEAFDVLVIGGGPAGMAAAVRAAECGVNVGIVDDNPDLGGQIWRRDSGDGRGKQAARWFSLLRTSGVRILCQIKVFHQPEPGVLLAEGTADSYEFHYRTLVLATGARERFLPFPGWTLPNVMGVGGLQVMVKSGLPIRGKRVVVAGTGPLLVAVAAYLRKQGAEIPLICEQAPWSRLAEFSWGLTAHPSKIIEALHLRKQTAGIPFAANCWPIAAHGRKALESVTVSRREELETITCDYLACGFHLVSNTELALLSGCQLSDGYVQVDDFQQTTVKRVFCAGEPTGIGGVELSLLEGQIAGYAAGGRDTEARKLFGPRAAWRRLARRMDRVFRLRDELRNLSSPDTIICRCEDVSYSHLQEHTSWRSAKLHTRCGMGPCQGRICGPATSFLFQWNSESVRPPISPARVASLAVLPSPNAEPSAVEGGL